MGAGVSGGFITDMISSMPRIVCKLNC